MEQAKDKVPQGYKLDNKADLALEINFLFLGRYMDYYIDYLAEKHTGGDIRVLKHHFDAEAVRKQMMGDVFGEEAEMILAGQADMPKVSVQDLFHDVHEPVGFEEFKTIKTNEYKILNTL